MNDATPRARFERATCRLEGGCSIQLSYRDNSRAIIGFTALAQARRECGRLRTMQTGVVRSPESPDIPTLGP